jgi:hypothetical protein
MKTTMTSLNHSFSLSPSKLDMASPTIDTQTSTYVELAIIAPEG